jgi:hypothetical protein
VEVMDRFRRDFPYARWYRYIAWQESTVVNGEPTVTIKSKLRQSVVHKTAIRERCMFSDAGFPSRWGLIQHLSELPAPEQEPYRAVLCEYCFPDT